MEATKRLSADERKILAAQDLGGANVAQAALEALPKIIDLMSEELHWSSTRKEREWKDSVAFLASMGLPKEQLGVSRRDVVSGKAKDYLDERTRKMFSRHGKPDDF